MMMVQAIMVPIRLSEFSQFGLTLELRGGFGEAKDVPLERVVSHFRGHDDTCQLARLWHWQLQAKSKVGIPHQRTQAPAGGCC